ncbi:nuclear GTPase SLIP-GC-like isoform X1 [Electrophorus electricus]|uniref:nuclear GTPase SLIP-GC-like isoform X1 n=1 Tax=Electrophorus electricus TaxID=8005 RepID=UPI0015CFF8C4|nr:nuclear GTPase SLIP-GC-like isoform X1 [Electrophorus electricus]
MNNKENKRVLENENPSAPHVVFKKQKLATPLSTVDMMKNITITKEKMKKVEHNFKKNSFHDYIRETITKLDETLNKKKKTTVGVFGKTGAGKSSLINAVLGGRDLLPSGTICACTSVIIQIEANVTDSNYTAEIEFISKKDWENELKNILSVISEDKKNLKGQNNESSEDITMADEKIKALYGNEGASKTLEDLMKDNNFSNIPEFLTSGKKTITHENASDLSEEIDCYIRHNGSSPGGRYWPIVASVTIMVPNCKDFLEHVVLVDLPGTGDCNKTRDEMWKSKLRDCSAVWIVSEIERAASDKSAWDILKNITDMAQGGECRSISFICTKTDLISTTYMRSVKLKDKDLEITCKDTQYKRKAACILYRNKEAKEEVKKSFDAQHIIKKYFNCDDGFLSIFTVSSEEFISDTPILEKEQTEIPKLQDLLKGYNNSQINEMGNQYVLGARGILYLIQGSRDTSQDMNAQKCQLYQLLEKNLHRALEDLQGHHNHVLDFLEELLSAGTKESEQECIKTATNVIKPLDRDNRGFHKILTALCKNNGYHRSRKGEFDLNNILATHMYNNIDNFFNSLFLSHGNVFEKSLQANIDKFTIITKDMMTEYNHSPMLNHVLNFLKIEENKVKSDIIRDLRQRKKKIYTSLQVSIKETMLPCYNQAAHLKGIGSMLKQQKVLLSYIENSKTEMFHKAKKHMLELLELAKNFHKDELKKNLKTAMKYSLLNASLLYMDVSKDLKELELLHSKYEKD